MHLVMFLNTFSSCTCQVLAACSCARCLMTSVFPHLVHLAALSAAHTGNTGTRSLSHESLMRTFSTPLLFSGVMFTFHPHGLNDALCAGPPFFHCQWGHSRRMGSFGCQTDGEHTRRSLEAHCGHRPARPRLSRWLVHPCTSAHDSVRHICHLSDFERAQTCVCGPHGVRNPRVENEHRERKRRRSKIASSPRPPRTGPDDAVNVPSRRAVVPCGALRRYMRLTRIPITAQREGSLGDQHGPGT